MLELIVTFIVADPSVSPGASSLPAYPAVSGLQYHATPNGSNPGYTLYYTPDGYLLPAAAAGTQSQVSDFVVIADFNWTTILAKYAG
jgi:hypothetical protein